jgi:hypothetical protein
MHGYLMCDNTHDIMYDMYDNMYDNMHEYDMYDMYDNMYDYMQISILPPRLRGRDT